jgi:hypothetical protein
LYIGELSTTGTFSTGTPLVKPNAGARVAAASSSGLNGAFR